MTTNKVNISQLLRNENSKIKNPKFQRIWNSFKWRQTYLNSDEYLLELNNGKTLKLQQISNGELKGLGTGSLVWPAAHVLSKYFEKSLSYYFPGKSVIDIGSGTGCTGLVAAFLGAKVTLTDQEPILFLLEKNLEINLNEALSDIDRNNIIIEKYDWGKCAKHLNPPFDCIIVSDCVLPKLYPIENLIQVFLLYIFLLLLCNYLFFFLIF
jgi:predicted nicotinamide N-methyase